MNTPINRRHFLRLAALAPLKEPRLCTLSPRSRAWFRPGLNAYFFLEQLNANTADAGTGMDFCGVSDFCAQHDIEDVDLTGYFFPGFARVHQRAAPLMKSCA